MRFKLLFEKSANNILYAVWFFISHDAKPYLILIILAYAFQIDFWSTKHTQEFWSDEGKIEQNLQNYIIMLLVSLLHFNISGPCASCL